MLVAQSMTGSHRITGAARGCVLAARRLRAAVARRRAAIAAICAQALARADHALWRMVAKNRKILRLLVINRLNGTDHPNSLFRVATHPSQNVS